MTEEVGLALLSALFSGPAPRPRAHWVALGRGPVQGTACDISCVSSARAGRTCIAFGAKRRKQRPDAVGP